MFDAWGRVQYDQMFAGILAMALLGVVLYEAIELIESRVADGRLYLHGENGDLALVEPTAEAYREHGQFAVRPTKARQIEGMGISGFANGRLYIRDLGVIWCYDVADSKQPDKSKANDASPAKQERMAKMHSADLRASGRSPPRRHRSAGPFGYLRIAA